MITIRTAFLFAASALCALNTFAATTVTEQAGDVVTDTGSVKTGAKSRAELRDDAGTLVRAGSHAAVKVDGRKVTVTAGSVLVKAPEGDTTVVHTVSGDLAFDAATVLVTVGADGATKVHVLSGEAKFTSSQGESASLDAGQMTLTGPGGAGDLPVTDFDLTRLAGSSRLVKGFNTPLPDLGAIGESAKNQQARIDSGKLRETGLVILSAGQGDGFRVAPSAVVGASVNSAAAHILRNTTPVVLTSAAYPGYVILAGASGTLLINASSGDILQLSGGTLQLGGDNTYSGSTTVNGGTLQLGNTTDSSGALVLTGTGFDLPLTNGTALILNLFYTGATLTGSPLNLTGTGNLTMTGGSVTATAGDITIGTNNPAATITITGTAFTTLEALRSIKFGANGKTPDTLAINGATFTANGIASISAEAKTLNLQNVAFPAQSIVALNSRDGVLNIGDSQVGAVNFISGVTYGGADLTTAAGINAHVNAPNGITQNGAAFIGATGNAAGEVTIGKLPTH